MTTEFSREGFVPPEEPTRGTVGFVEELIIRARASTPEGLNNPVERLTNNLNDLLKASISNCPDQLTLTPEQCVELVYFFYQDNKQYNLMPTAGYLIDHLEKKAAEAIALWPVSAATQRDHLNQRVLEAKYFLQEVLLYADILRRQRHNGLSTGPIPVEVHACVPRPDPHLLDDLTRLLLGDCL